MADRKEKGTPKTVTIMHKMENRSRDQFLERKRKMTVADGRWAILPYYHCIQSSKFWKQNKGIPSNLCKNAVEKKV